MAVEGGPDAAALHVPQTDGMVVAGTGQGLPVRGKGHRPHSPHVLRFEAQGGLELAGLHLPPLDRIVGAADGDGPASGREGHGEDTPGRAAARCHPGPLLLEGSPELAAGHVPQPDPGVVVAAGQSAPARREGQVVDHVLVAMWQDPVSARSHIPQSDLAVAPAAGKRRAVRREGQGLDPGPEPLEGVEVKGFAYRPQPDRAVGATARQRLPVRREGHGEDVPQMPPEDRLGPGGLHGPQPDLLVLAAGRRQERAVRREGQGDHHPLVPLQQAFLVTSAGQVPQPDPAALAPAGQGRPVRGEGQNADPVRSPIQPGEVGAGPAVPDPDAVLAAQGQSRAVGRESHDLDFPPAQAGDAAFGQRHRFAAGEGVPRHQETEPGEGNGPQRSRLCYRRVHPGSLDSRDSGGNCLLRELIRLTGRVQNRSEAAAATPLPGVGDKPKERRASSGGSRDDSEASVANSAGIPNTAAP